MQVEKLVTVVIWDDNGTRRVIREELNSRDAAFKAIDGIKRAIGSKIEYGYVMTNKQVNSEPVFLANRAIARSRKGKITAFMLHDDWRVNHRDDVLIFNNK